MSRAIPTRALGAVPLASALFFASGDSARAVDAAPGAPEFLPIAQDLLSPRCMNCHPIGDAPLVGDHAERHRMNVSRKSPEAGLPCTSCHREQNGPVPHSPPGVHDWHMPPRETPMVFQGKTPHELCVTLKDPAQNGGKDLPALEEHFTTDLVKWGFAPGPGRTVPPVPYPELFAHVQRWIAAGAPCP